MASYAEEAAKAKVNSVYMDVLDQIRTSREQIENKQRQMQVLASRQATTVRTRELYQEQYKLGTRSLVDLLNAEQAIHSANSELESARYDIYSSIVQYIEATGRSRQAYGLNNISIQGSKYNHDDKINYQPWLQAVLTIAKHYRIEPSEERIRLQLDWNQNQNLDNVLQLMTRQVGLNLRKAPFSLDLLNPWRLPVMVEFNDGQVGVIDKADTQGNVSIQFSGDQGLSQSLSLDALKTTLKNVYILRPETSIPDARIDEYIKPYEANWFWSIVLRDWKRYVDIMFASLIANVLALATIIFSMQVYDRVVPSQSIPTLWVLAGGVLIAALLNLPYVFHEYIYPILLVNVLTYVCRIVYLAMP